MLLRNLIDDGESSAPEQEGLLRSPRDIMGR